MNIDFRPFIILWAVLAAVVIALIFYRRSVAQAEDDSLHVLEGPKVAEQQVVMAHKLEVIDKWGKVLTVVVVVFGAILGALYLYQSWVQMSHTGL